MPALSPQQTRVLCGLTQVGLQLQKREAVPPELCPARNESGGYLSREEVLTDTSSAARGFIATPVTLQPSHTPGAATLLGGSSGEKTLLARPGH